jgi:hypothetical protein
MLTDEIGDEAIAAHPATQEIALSCFERHLSLIEQ